MLIAEASRGVAIPLTWRTRITRLGEEIAGGHLLPAALDRTAAALAEFADEARRERVCRVKVVATSAVRDADNATELIDRAYYLNLPVEVLDGEREAALTHLGASAELDPSVRCLVIDVGGGSTELVLGLHGRVESRVSLDVGCVRMKEKYPLYDPPIPEQTDALQRIVMEAFRPFVPQFAGVSDLPSIAVAGTATSLAAIQQRLEVYDPQRVHGYYMPRQAVLNLVQDLGEVTLDELRRIPVLEAGRADVIVHGACILAGLMRLFDLPGVSVSEHGILYGLALELACQVS